MYCMALMKISCVYYGVGFKNMNIIMVMHTQVKFLVFNLKNISDMSDITCLKTLSCLQQRQKQCYLVQPIIIYSVIAIYMKIASKGILLTARILRNAITKKNVCICGIQSREKKNKEILNIRVVQQNINDSICYVLQDTIWRILFIIKC